MTSASLRLARSEAARRQWEGLTHAERVDRTAGIRQRYLDQLADQVDPDHTMPPEQRTAAAEARRREIMTALSRKAADARRAAAEQRRQARLADLRRQAEQEQADAAR